MCFCKILRPKRRVNIERQYREWRGIDDARNQPYPHFLVEYLQHLLARAPAQQTAMHLEALDRTRAPRRRTQLEQGIRNGVIRARRRQCLYDMFDLPGVQISHRIVDDRVSTPDSLVLPSQRSVQRQRCRRARSRTAFFRAQRRLENQSGRCVAPTYCEHLCTVNRDRTYQLLVKIHLHHRLDSVSNMY